MFKGQCREKEKAERKVGQHKCQDKLLVEGEKKNDRQKGAKVRGGQNKDSRKG